jgi:hypothetical protein
MKSVSITDLFVLSYNLKPVTVREISTVLQYEWQEVNEACWLVKSNVQLLYMHKKLTVKDVRKNVPKKGDSQQTANNGV